MHVNKMKFKRKTSLSIITFTILGKQNKLKRSITSQFYSMRNIAISFCDVTINDLFYAFHHTTSSPGF